MKHESPYDFEFFRPNKGYGSLELEVMGARSMAPFFKVGDMIQVRETPFHELTPGDIIVFHTPHAVCANRVIRILEESGMRRVVPKADSYLVSDKAIGRNAYIGKVVSMKSKGRYLKFEKPFWKKMFVLVAYCSKMQLVLNSACRLVPSTLRRRVLRGSMVMMLYVLRIIAHVYFETNTSEKG